MSYSGESRAAFFMLLISVIGLFTIPLLPWMMNTYDYPEGSGAVHTTELDIMGNADSVDEDLENMATDLTWIGYCYMIMTALAAIAVIGTLLNRAGYSPTVGYIGGAAAMMAILIIILHVMYIIHVADYNDEHGGDEEFFGETYSDSYMMGINLIPLACAVLMVPLSVKHIFALDR